MLYNTAKTTLPGPMIKATPSQKECMSRFRPRIAFVLGWREYLIN
jgi:hypothetical protein